MATPRAGSYYDWLSRWTAVARVAGYGGGRDRLTVHRALADPRHQNRPTVTRLHDLLFEALPGLATGRVLDAGCGMGGTMLDLALRGTASFTGLTLSSEQARIGRRAIARSGLTTRVAILVRNYDDPPNELFSAAIAIESLAHSPDPGVSLKAIVSCLLPGASVAIVDDMPEPGAGRSADLALFKAGWQLPVLWTADELLAALRDNGCTPIENRDLSAAVRPRPMQRIAALEALNRTVRRFVPTAAARTLLDSYRGGLALERLYRHGLMTYRLIVARNDEA